MRFPPRPRIDLSQRTRSIIYLVTLCMQLRKQHAHDAYFWFSGCGVWTLCWGGGGLLHIFLVSLGVSVRRWGLLISVAQLFQTSAHKTLSCCYLLFSLTWSYLILPLAWVVLLYSSSLYCYSSWFWCYSACGWRYSSHHLLLYIIVLASDVIYCFTYGARLKFLFMLVLLFIYLVSFFSLINSAITQVFCVI